MRRAWLPAAVLLAVSFAAAAGAGAPAAAQTIHLQYISERWMIELHNLPPQLCVREAAKADVIVRRLGVYWDGSQLVYFERPVDAAVGGYGGVVVSSSASAVLSMAPNNFPSGVAAFHQLTGQAKQVGSAEITVEAVSALGTLTTASFTVDVTECDYNVHSFSIWHIDAGFQVVAGTSVDTVIKRQVAQGYLYASQGAVAENTAVAFPIGGCRPTYTTSQSDAFVEAVGLGSILDVTIEFGRLETGIEVCHVPHVNGGTSGGGKPDTVDVEIPPGGGSASDSQDAEVDGLGTFTGNVWVTLVAVHV